MVVELVTFLIPEEVVVVVLVVEVRKEREKPPGKCGTWVARLQVTHNSTCHLSYVYTYSVGMLLKAVLVIQTIWFSWKVE